LYAFELRLHEEGGLPAKRVAEFVCTAGLRFYMNSVERDGVYETQTATAYLLAELS